MNYMIKFIFLSTLCFISHTKQLISAPSKEEKKGQTIHLRSLMNQIFNLEKKATQTSNIEIQYDEIEKIESYYKKIQSTLDLESHKKVMVQLQKIKSSLKKNQLSQKNIFSLKQFFIDIFEIETAPALPPQEHLGRLAYKSYCSSCHGMAGDGKGVLSAKLPSPPRSFNNIDFKKTSSPLSIINKMLLEKTEDPYHSFEDILSHQERWSLSFYIQNGKFNQGNDPKINLMKDLKAISNMFTYSELGKFNNQEIWSKFTRTKFYQRDQNKFKQSEVIDHLRSYTTFQLKISRK